LLHEVGPSGNSPLSFCRRWPGVKVSTKADRAGMSVVSSFVNGRVIAGKLSRVVCRQSVAVCIGIESNGQESSGIDCFMSAGG